MVTMRVDTKRDRQAEENQGGGTKNNLFYKPLPKEAGRKQNNKVVVAGFYPDRWKFFNPTEADFTKFGYSNPGLVGFNEHDYGTFFWRFYAHDISNFVNQDGTTGFTSVCCPVKTNKYMVEVLGMRPPFKTDIRCPFCEEEQRWWQSQNHRFEEMGVDRKALSPDGYRGYVDSDPELKRAYTYLLVVFDADKLSGVRPLEEGESLSYQIYFAPKSVFTPLRDMFEAGVNFYSFDGGIRPLIITKDTTACKGNNLRDTTYSLINTGAIEQVDPAWLGYLADENNLPDPSDTIKLVTYEDGLFQISRMMENSNVAPPAQTVNRGVQAPPAPMPAPIVAPPVTPTTPIAPPVMPTNTALPPPVAPTTTAVAPPPVMPPVNPVPVPSLPSVQMPPVAMPPSAPVIPSLPVAPSAVGPAFKPGAPPPRDPNSIPWK
jgi:hypothetical protein